MDKAGPSGNGAGKSRKRLTKLNDGEAKRRKKELGKERAKRFRARKKLDKLRAARLKEQNPQDSSSDDSIPEDVHVQDDEDQHWPGASQDGNQEEEESAQGNEEETAVSSRHPDLTPVAIPPQDNGSESSGTSSSQSSTEDEDSPTLVPTRGEGDGPEGVDSEDNSQVPRMIPSNIPALKEHLAKSLASKKATSNISDAGLQKIYRVMHDLAKEVVFLQEHEAISGNYRHSLKDIAMEDIPDIWNCVEVETVEEGEVQFERHDKLKKVPEKYWNLGENTNQKVLRVHAYIKLRDVKAHHLKKHRGREGFTEESLKRDLAQATLSLDGVKESNHGKRTFIIVTIRFGSCIYLWRVFNPLLGDKSAAMNPEDLCG